VETLFERHFTFDKLVKLNVTRASRGDVYDATCILKKSTHNEWLKFQNPSKINLQLWIGVENHAVKEYVADLLGRIGHFRAIRSYGYCERGTLAQHV
jgi:hypothetical protein